MEPLNGHNPYQYGEGVEERRRSDKDGDRHRDRDRDRERDRDRDRERDSHKDRDRDRDRKRDRSRRSRSRSRSRKKDVSRSKSQSPPPPSQQRRLRKTFFDVPPSALPGAEAAVPGALPPPPMLSSVLPAPPVIVPPPVATATGFVIPAGMSAAQFSQPPSQQATRHARRVYVGGLPPSANEQSIAYFFSNALAAVGGNSAGPGNAVVNVYINREKNFAFVEFRTVEETSNAMALDGIMFEGVSVRVRRPNDYNPAAAATLGPSVPSPNLNLSAIGLSSGGASITDAHERVFVGGLPYYLNEEQCRELLGSFGPIKSFDLVKDRETGNSKGYGFVVYADPTVTDIACAGLNGLKMGDRTLTVRRATEAAPGEAIPGSRPMVGSITGATTLSAATRIITLAEAVTIDELRDDSEYSDILEDMREECGKYGSCIKVIIPRPTEPPPSGLGKVIVEFGDVNAAVKACNALHGRRFGGRTVMATYLSEEAYGQGDFD